MANPEHLRLLEQGVEAWNAWRRENVSTRLDLSEANLGGANLIKAYLSGASLTKVNLSEAKLYAADLSEANLVNADLSGASLTKADLGEAIQFYSCFISYSSLDEEFCRRLHGRLQDAGLRVWFAPHDIQGGRKLHEQLDDAIRVYDKLLLVLSSYSMQSPWVEFEIRRARKREVAEKRRLLFPVRLVNYEAIKTWECFDVYTAKDLATEIREYYIPDFTAWKDHDAFEVAVGRLLRDLKAADRQPEGARPVG